MATTNLPRILLLGANIANSASVTIHQQLSAKFNKSYTYDICELAENATINALTHIMLSSNLVGANVTNPFKRLFINNNYKLCPVAISTQAVNTIALKDGNFYATNTDVLGFKQSLAICELNLAKQHVLVLGSGATALSVIYACQQLNISAITIVGRNASALNNLVTTCRKFLSAQVNLQAINASITRLDNNSLPDIIINTTSAGKYNCLPAYIAQLKLKDKIVFDVNYPPYNNLLAQYCTAQKVRRYIDGKTMLEQQAVASFDFWFNAY